ncbi:MAG TPA: hypothetical protein ENI27_06790 [bacterium]|nr:hypothetical protein [bacterium]
MGKRRHDGTTALVKADKKNKKALEMLRDRLIEVRKMMMEFMSPEMIENTLARATDRLLPRPKKG